MAHYVFHKDKLIQNIDKLKTSYQKYHKNFKLFYSVKTNYSNEVLNTISKNDSFEIVSGEEWNKVKVFKPAEIVINGPAKREMDIE